MLTLSNYSATENAREIRVKKVGDVAIKNVYGDNITDALVYAGVLRDDGYYETEAITSDICAAIDSFGLFGVNAAPESYKPFDATTERERASVALYSTRYERAGRDGLREYRTYRILRYLSVGHVDATTAQRAAAPLLQLVEVLCNLRLTYDDGSLYVVDSIEVEPIDSEQFAQNLIYCGYIDLTITRAQAGAL